MHNERNVSELTHLGEKNQYSYDYNKSLLDSFDNKFPDNEYWVTINNDEFTSLCPKTNQPDFASVIINYIPGNKLVESKSLKLYLFSFVNEGSFHEDVINIIGQDLVDLMNPKYLEVYGIFYPRGNLSINPRFYYSDKEHTKLKKKRIENYNVTDVEYHRN